MAARKHTPQSPACSVPNTIAAPTRRAAPLALAIALAVGAANAAAGVGMLEIVSRPHGNTLPVYGRDGRNWVVGTPGQEYGIRVCNRTGDRALAVMSVDGVNVVSGETASPSQSGYVLSAHECATINGWRKNQSATAAFYFTELPDAYAARTGRPENVGVIGVAFFRERQERTFWRESSPKIGAAAPESRPRQDAAASANAAAESQAGNERMARGDAASTAAEGRASNDTGSRRELAADSAAPSAPAPMAKIGTGHGRHEHSYVQTTRFTRESSTPTQTLAINYDRRENLVAMGILPPPAIARNVNPFPAWSTRFVPDPPTR